MLYFDYNATTPIDRAVADSMVPYLYDTYGNPSSSHELGKAAKKAVETSREKVAALLNCSPYEIVFTSGGSESNNTVLKSVAFIDKAFGDHIITSKIEHPSILNPCVYLKKNGKRISYIPVDEEGIIIIDEFIKLLDNQTILVSIMHSNNETGSLQPIKEIVKICHEKDILVHTDASQSIGKVPVDVKDLGVDFLTLAGHKLYGPKGIGALYVKEDTYIEPLIHGAGHEMGRRAGTENIILEVGLGKACELAKKELLNPHIKEVTTYFYDLLIKKFKDRIILNGSMEKRLPNTLNISFLGYRGQDILDQMSDVAASTGSACHSESVTYSPVLKAMNLSEERMLGAIRFSLGRKTTKAEVEEVVSKLEKIVK